jgi:hypothetical protein
LKHIVESIDKQIMEKRDKARYCLKDVHEIDMDTLFGTVTFKRRIYLDRQTEKHVYLLDQMFQYDGQKKAVPAWRRWLSALPVRGLSRLGKFLTQHYELDRDTWLVVNGD